MFQLFRKPKIIPKDQMFRNAFSKHIPDTAVDYVMSLWTEHPFYFKVARSRKTCLGNYMFKNGAHHISVNGDSNAYSFLITLIHEIAHQRVQIHQSLFKRKPSPHGETWKKEFSRLMSPLLTPNVFPEDILEVLIPHMQDPAASTVKDPNLVKVLAHYSPEKEGIYLSDLPDGEEFLFKGRRFKRIAQRRTRILVECVTSKKRYTIPGIAHVEP
jgi:SprT protein